jgi:hypothetical protein
MDGNDVPGEIPEWICDLVTLVELQLEYNNFEGAVPSCIGRLIKLKSLNISDSKNLAGVLPIGICDLVQLNYLEIEDTSVEGNASPINSRQYTSMFWESHNADTTKLKRQ